MIIGILQSLQGAAENNPTPKIWFLYNSCTFYVGILLIHATDIYTQICRLLLQCNPA